MPHPVYILTIYQPTTFIILVIVSNYDRQKQNHEVHIKPCSMLSYDGERKGYGDKAETLWEGEAVFQHN